eukprot:SM000229S07494  [mRNA]  locus=s229:27820:31480:+ [translate_table: standard]
MDNQRISFFHFKAIIVAGMVSPLAAFPQSSHCAGRGSTLFELLLTYLDKSSSSLADEAGQAGFFTDAYDLFSIGLITKLIGRVYYSHPGDAKPGVLPVAANSCITGLALVGTLCGQLFFGWAGDRFGRKRVYGYTLMMMIVFAVGSALSAGRDPLAVVVTLCVMRFFLGFGIGGDYPLSATIMSEFANTATRGAFIAAVFSMQGVGILMAGAVTLLFAGVFKDAYPAPSFAQDPARSINKGSDYVWRIVVSFGAIFTAATLYARMTMPETARYTQLVMKDKAKAAADMSKVLGREVTYEEVAAVEATQVEYTWSTFMRRFKWTLFGTASTWFLLDISFYSQNLFQSRVYTAIGWVPAASKMSSLEETFKLARAQTLVALWSTFPGYWFTVFTVDWIGRRPIQIGGFALMTVFLAILAFDYNPLRDHNKAAFVAMYSLTFFFSNWGPNATTFILPAEVFPARFRSTAHGMSAAAGKFGSIVGTYGFLYASQSTHTAHTDRGYPTGIGLPATLGILAAVSLIGTIISIFLTPETKGRSLEQLSEETETALVADAQMANNKPRFGLGRRRAQTPAETELNGGVNGVNGVNSTV